MNSRLARRYAGALFDLADEQGLLVETQRELEMIATAAKQLRLSDFDDPEYPEAGREALRQALITLPGAGTLVRGLLSTLIARRRIGLLGEIGEQFRQRVDQAQGRGTAWVTSAHALRPEERRGIVAVLERLSGLSLDVVENTDPGILGGFVAQVGSMVYDASLSTQIEVLRRRLVKGL